MAEIPLVSVSRPDGRVYRPRKVVGYRWENDGYPNDECGVVIVGTHDLDRARRFATDLIRHYFDNDLCATKPDVGWWRLGYRNGEPTWVADPVRGRAGVMFTADYADVAAALGCGEQT